MQYDRTFKFSASHYGPWHHAMVWKAIQEDHMSAKDLMLLMSKLHGHNWKVRVSFEYEQSESDTVYGVWDEDIEAVVMEWNNCNLSMHPDFFQQKWISSTEVTAETLANKLLKGFPANAPSVTVVMHETDDIFVTAQAYREELPR